MSDRHASCTFRTKAAYLGIAVLVALLAAPVLAEPLPPQVSAVAIPDGQIDKAVAGLDGIAQAILKQSGIPGMAIAVVQDGRTVYAKGFGVRKVGETAAVDADTVFQIASLSKSLSGSVVAHQVGAGVIAWDTPVVAHLPWFALKDPWVTQHVTIADLFSHRSGLPDHAGDNLEDIGFDRRELLERLRLLPLEGFRDTYAYTNFGLTAAAESVAAASGKTWEDLATAVLYEPLGMNSTSSRFADFEKRPDRAFGHVKVGGGYQPKYQRQPDAQSPAGGVSSSVNDLARWMTMILQDGEFNGQQIIPEGALLPAITAEMISSPSYAVDARPSFYGYGFGVGITPSGRVLISHSGGFALGAGTYYAMLPSAHVGIVVLTNAAANGVAESVGASFMDLVQFGAVTQDWLGLYTPRFNAMSAPAGDLVGKSPPEHPTAAGKLASYAGVYDSPYFGEATIREVDDHLELSIGPAGKAYPLIHWDGDTFAVSPSSENEPDGSLSSVAFEPNGEMKIGYLDPNGFGRFVRR
ncbi:serine hydrolase [Kaistia algarum]|uniref:serine hydrolase n=1 Tax=Kaistia algarum TaxID=2083279 RepID=UPI000CE7FD21|nr:serine hydrolase [Kaistia algarum]MCX5516418.1 serine hydrolase [Kaistia algarum]PPE77493.1 serine hydrolase [Kaistia algarum]